MRLLFVCDLGEVRSRTAASFFSDKHMTRYKGVKENLVEKEDVEWADVIYVFDDTEQVVLAKMFGQLFLTKKTINLEIPEGLSQGELIDRFSELGI